MNMHRKDEYTDHLTRSLNGMQRASAPGHLFERIQQRIQKTGQVIRLVPKRKVHLAAASLLLLVTLNMVVAKSRKPAAKQTDAVETLVQYYELSETGRP